jgi:hypothetical protein
MAVAAAETETAARVRESATEAAEKRAAGKRATEVVTETASGAAEFLTVAEVAALLREGDVVFRRGGGIVSRAVLAADRGGGYSHVGVVARLEGRLVVVHVVPGEPDARGVRDVVKAEAPEAFFAPRRARRGAVMRLREADDADNGDGIRANDADRGAGKDAQTLLSAKRAAEAWPSAATGVRVARAALELARARVPFDHGYDLGDTTRMYCTELVWHLFRREGVDLSGGRRTTLRMPALGGTFIMPSDIEKDPNLTLILKFRSP